MEFGCLLQVLSLSCLIFPMVLVYFFFVVHLSLYTLCVLLRSVRRRTSVTCNGVFY